MVLSAAPTGELKARAAKVLTQLYRVATGLVWFAVIDGVIGVIAGIALATRTSGDLDTYGEHQYVGVGLGLLVASISSAITLYFIATWARAYAATNLPRVWDNQDTQR